MKAQGSVMPYAVTAYRSISLPRHANRCFISKKPRGNYYLLVVTVYSGSGRDSVLTSVLGNGGLLSIIVKLSQLILESSNDIDGRSKSVGK